MYRGTTPRLALRVKGIDLAQIKSAYVTFEQDGTELEKTKNDLTFDTDAGLIYAALSQNDTLRFKAHRRVRVQLRALCKDGSAIASSISEIYVAEILKDGVIEGA